MKTLERADMSLMRNVLLAGSESAWLRERAMRYRFVRRSVSRFMPGETLDEALAAARTLQQDQGLGTILTKLGENLTSAAEADAATAHYLEALERIRAGQFDVQVSVKPTQLGLDLDPEQCYRNLRRLTERARTTGNMVWIDMESTPYVDPTLALFRRVREEFREIGVCLQAYLYRTRADVEALVPLGPFIRLVKGAYNEPAALAYPRKADVDENFFALASRMLGDEARGSGTRLAIGTHDAQVIARLQRVIRDTRVPAEAFEFEMLFGIQRGVQAALKKEGWPVRVLISYGEYWFPWYMRRLAERPANVLFVAKNLFGG
jgi:proline dehydrogenase